MSTYQQTLDYLYSQLPMFHRIGAAAYKADLSNTLKICEVLGNPERDLKAIHVAGTNGKGSVSHMLASIFQEAGYKTGLYTSPHLIDFRERIKINGEMIPQQSVISFVEKYKDQFEEIKPSFFEWTVGLCFDYFRNENVEIAVIETGLGGRLDSTNVITPLLSIITNISFDHQALLGDTIEKIAAEKAGIIKEKIPVIIGETAAGSSEVFIEKAKEKGSKITFADQVMNAETSGVTRNGRTWIIEHEGKKKTYKCQLKGLYQGMNIKTVLAATIALKDKIDLTEHVIENGLSHVVDNTGLLGRWQIISENPRVICDTGHNEAGINEILKNLKEESYNKLHWILGMVNDKEIDKVLNMLPKNAEYYFTKASIPRALDEHILTEKANAAGLSGTTLSSVIQAVKAAIQAADTDDLIMIGGSTFTVGDALQHIDTKSFTK